MKYLFLTAAFILFLSACDDPSGMNSVLEAMDFVVIPAGSFMMGSPEDEEGRYANESPLHEVTINYSFELQTTEVSQALWEEVMGSNPSYFLNPGSPVECVSQNDCMLFIEKLNQLDSRYSYRLPTEAEWEYACRAGTTTRYYSGDSEDHLKQIGWFDHNSGSTTEECARLAPNSWGLYDMSGNVWEWCTDYFHESYEGAPPDGSAWLENPTSNAVSRGGSVGSSLRRCRSAARDACDPDLHYYFLGLRLVRTQN